MYPKEIPSFISGKEVVPSEPQERLEKYCPSDGSFLATVPGVGTTELAAALEAARVAQKEWRAMSVATRAEVLKRATVLLSERASEAIEIVRTECGRPDKELSGEVGSAVAAGNFFSGLAHEFEEKILPSSSLQRTVSLRRAPVGIGAIFTPFNTPLAQIAAKTFPALLCGNAIILKAHELTPHIGVWFAGVLKDAGIPDGLFNVLQGTGARIGSLIVAHPDIAFISFTGSSGTGARIVEASAHRLAKVSIEGGGKNPFVVCDDADIEKAAALASASMMVDNGQRCAAATRFIVFDTIYDTFVTSLKNKLAQLKIGAGREADIGALISEKRLTEVITAVEGAVARGAHVVCGGTRLDVPGYFMEPTLLDGVSQRDEISQRELFGPVGVLHRVANIEDAIALANDSSYRLSAAIHTGNNAYVEQFVREHGSGVVRVNGPTFGSEPHMPFGGPGLSGNGWREPGVTALDFYGNWQQVSVDS